MSLGTMARTQATSAIKRYGAPAKLTRTTKGQRDPATGVTPTTTEEFATSAVLDSANLQGMGFKFGADLVKTGDVSVMVPALPKPRELDRLTITRGDMAGYFLVVAVNPTMAGEVAVSYTLLVRR